MFLHIFERDTQLGVKLTLKVLHSGNYKQNVPLPLAIFDETNSVAIQSHFHEHSRTVEILKLFQRWWVISNYKSQFFNKHLFRSCRCTRRPQSISFWQTMAAWIKGRQQESISNCDFIKSLRLNIIRKSFKNQKFSKRKDRY